MTSSPHCRITREELTNLIFAIRVVMLENQGLVPALDSHDVEWSRHNRITAEIHLGNQRPIPIESEEALFPIIQEDLVSDLNIRIDSNPLC